MSPGGLLTCTWRRTDPAQANLALDKDNPMLCKPVALVLAAGRSQRFGGDKRQQRLSNGLTLLQSSLLLPCAVFEEVWLALREDDSVPLDLPSKVRIVQCASSRLGLGHSIAASVQRISAVSEGQALAVFLADMPFIHASTLDTLLASAAPDRICRPAYQGKTGHPVIFGRDFWAELSQLADDSGARSVVKANSHAVHTLTVDDPGVLIDIDRPSDVPPAQSV